MEIIEKPINDWKYNKKNIVVYETINDKNIQIFNKYIIVLPQKAPKINVKS